MALNSLPALQVQSPAINTMANFQQSQNNAIQQRDADFQHKQDVVKALGVMGLSALKGNIDGTPDPQIWDQVIAHAKASGVPEEALAGLEGHPEMASVLARGSLETLKVAQDKQLFDLQLKKFGLDIEQAKRAASAPIEVSPGASLAAPGQDGYQTVYTAPKPEAVDSTPTVVSVYDANGREQKGYMGPKDAAHPDGFYPLGNPKADTPRADFTVSQANAAGYADRMIQSDAILSNPALTKAQTDLVEQGKSKVPGIGNYLTSAEFQQADQAQRDFINAILRRESGAVISDSEFANARKQYFPQPGDSEAVLKQKAANRRQAIHGVARAAGPAYTPPDTTNYLDNPDALASTDAPPSTEDVPSAAGPGAEPPSDYVPWTDYM